MVNETTAANPEGVEFPSLWMFNPFRVAIVNWSQPRVPLGASPVAIHVGDAVGLWAQYVIAFMKRHTKASPKRDP